MIQINDLDLPITVAEKIINAQHMFNLDEIKEIADYLMIYYQAHINGNVCLSGRRNDIMEHEAEQDLKKESIKRMRRITESEDT